MLKDRQGMTYASREDVKRALDIVETARADDQIDRALASASDNIEGLLLRRFYPEARTQTFDWPDPLGTTSLPYTVYFDRHDVIMVWSLRTDDGVITSPNFHLYPDDGPPYTRLELDVDSSSTFHRRSAGQRSITIDGIFGYSNDTESAGTITSALTAAATTVDVSDGTPLIGVGDLLKVGTEYMTVTEKGFLDSTETLAADVALGSASSITVSDGSAFVSGEVLLLDSERMLVIDVNADVLAVKRAWDGSTLSAHTSGAAVLVQRRLTVRRGVLGTSAAAHDATAEVLKHIVPPMVRSLAIAEAMAVLLQERTGYARVIGSGEGESEVRGIGLADLRDQTHKAYGRKKSKARAV